MKTLWAIAALTIVPASLPAQGWIEPLPGRPEFGVVKVRTVVTARVTGRIALVEVEEWFRNDGIGLGEGDYLYPLPGEAVFSNFSLYQGDQEFRGEMMDADQARAIYEEIVRRKRDPALIELAGHGLVRARVFPIQHGETRRITLRFTQVLERAGDALHFRYAAGGRYSVTADRKGIRAPLAFTLVADSGEMFGEPFSPTHRVTVRRAGNQLTVRPEGEFAGDLSLFLPLALSRIGITVSSHRPAGEDGYVMLTLSPERVSGRTMPRDITVALDVSGSMSGSKITQAKAALRQILSSLDEHDRFRLVVFSNTVRVQSPAWSSPTSDLDEALDWIDNLHADGGTNIEGALAEVFHIESPDSRLPIVIFITDGIPSVGEQNPELIAGTADRDRGRARVFAFGVGNDVNTYLLDRLSDAGRGATQYVEPGEDVERALSMLAAKIRHPVLTDLEIIDVPVELHDIYPVTLPDLFAGEELVIFGRYRLASEPASGPVTVVGNRGTRTERYATDVEFPAHELGNDFIPRLWASRKIGYLSRQLRLTSPNDELVEEIRRTALRYGLLSEFTSYLVQEPEVIASGGRRPSIMAQRSAPLAPAASVGAGAVAAAKRSVARREGKTSFDVNRADEALATELTGDSERRHVAGRIFRQQDDRWMDVTHVEGRPVIKIAAYSDAYFAVVRALPEVKPYWAAFDRVLITGAQLDVEIAVRGKTSLDRAQLERLVYGFRGQ